MRWSSMSHSYVVRGGVGEGLRVGVVLVGAGRMGRARVGSAREGLMGAPPPSAGAAGGPVVQGADLVSRGAGEGTLEACAVRPESGVRGVRVRALLESGEESVGWVRVGGEEGGQGGDVGSLGERGGQAQPHGETEEECLGRRGNRGT